MKQHTTLKRVLILGGTTEANDLANLLAEDNQLEVITSRAGVTKKRKTVAGQERVGGFGGIDGLKHYLRDKQISAVVDATHPFAQAMTAHAFQACTDLNIPHVILSRPTWIETDADRWINVEDIEGALNHLRSCKKPWHAFITTGQKELEAFTNIPHHKYLARMIEQPELSPLPTNIKILFERGPFSLANEIKLLQEHSIDIIISKNSGGEATAAKLQAARKCHIPVLMISRPELPPANVAESPELARKWLSNQ
ncbi:cobalt-precorrin-6A reductase [Kiloniella sp.]|uniref:cobalt-precorrin-6A reductase n=1 Tax=Kiloniella sp. TaxID=1938587 RepID=UPI003B029ACE